MDNRGLSITKKGYLKPFNLKKPASPHFWTALPKEFPDHTALLFQGFKVTFRELNDMVNRFSACPFRFGIRKGDSVAILLPNVIPCVVGYYATLKIGCHCVMNNPLYSDRELLHQFNDSDQNLDYSGSSGQPDD